MATVMRSRQVREVARNTSRRNGARSNASTDTPLSPVLEKTESLVGELLSAQPTARAMLGVTAYLGFLALLVLFFYSTVHGGDSDELKRARTLYTKTTLSVGEYVVGQQWKFTGTPFFLDKLFSSTEYHQCARVIGEQRGVFITLDGTVLHPGQPIYDDALRHEYLCLE